jgi:prepilin-type processing-associated H-X9-DG protein
MHPGGCIVLMADGSVRLLRETIDPRTFEALATIAGGEPVGEGWSE